tara:strand:+ start:776 stop:943 length:168 start_codon:yes stop_codon:yes gene_type:complete
MRDRKTWVYLYGDECPAIWQHFGFTHQDRDDRMKLKFIEYESIESQLEVKENEDD